jgi:hypothetical protein
MNIALFVLAAVLSAAQTNAAGANAMLSTVLAERIHEGRVDYAGLKKHRDALDKWLGYAAAVPEKEFDAWGRDERLAFLINVYNATTLRLIVDHYPIASIRKIGPFWDPKAPWHQPVVSLFGRKMTLDDLEQGVIRPKYKEPRVHFALVCAAKGCPPLRSEAYEGVRLSAQLDDQGRVFLSQKAKNDASPNGKIAYLSPIFKWYMADFGGTKASLLAFVKKWLPVEDNWTVDWTEYDWSLNEGNR